jgi:hypothetical protein
MIRPFHIARAVTILLAVAAGAVFALAIGAEPLWPLAAGQEAGVEIRAVARVFPDVGPGLETVKRDGGGKYYLAAAAWHGVAIYDADGNHVGQIPNENSGEATIDSALDIDVDADGRLLVVDRGANTVKIFAADGSLDATVPVAAATYVVALTGGDFAVSTAGASPAINIYDGRGKRLRSFTALPAAARQLAMNRYVSLGIMCGDLSGHFYFAYAFLPEPVIRKYDRSGAALYEIPIHSDEFTGGQDRLGDALSSDRRQDPVAKPGINALGVDPGTQEVWAAFGNTLVVFDKEGRRRAAYRTFTPEGARLEAHTILVEPERILIGADPLGVFAFARPERGRAAAPR